MQPLGIAITTVALCGSRVFQSLDATDQFVLGRAQICNLDTEVVVVRLAICY
jgi:hypothetical protein